MNYNSAISIHALREEGDVTKLSQSNKNIISIHALREEGDSILKRWSKHTRRFLSTPSARRATSESGSQSGTNIISIHALREEGDFTYYDPRLAALGISIHALREEGDSSGASRAKDRWRISIHALREEGDMILPVCRSSGA